MADPVSWLVVEKGWRVVDADGSELGSIDGVLGDEETDIFNGLSVSVSLLGPPRYVPSEHVREIVDGRVQLDLDRTAFERLSEHEWQRPGERSDAPDG